jgi:5-methylcytosine-specific restriction endonuclease McrA
MIGTRPRRQASDRAILAQRDGLRCHLCGEGPREGDSFEVDHDVSLACGGSDELANKRLAHASCNRLKGGR